MTRYFDHAATTPMRQVAIDTWVAHAGELNAGGQYAVGRQARRVVDEAREEIAELLGAEPIEVIFTASGTEANNLAVQGLFRASESNRIVATPIEHPAVDATLTALRERSGAQVDYLPVSRSGHVSDLSELDTPAALAVCMHANNETGALQPVEDGVARAQATDTPVHVDAVQAIGRIPVNFRNLGATTLASSAHKFGGPRGTGLLLARRSPAPAAILHGGGQERGIRPGTVDVASAAATAAALREAVSEMEAESARLGGLRDALRDGILARVDNVLVNTVEPALPSHLHLTFPGADGDSMIMLLDVAGVAASTGSACNAGVSRFSHVLEAMGVSAQDGIGSLRFTLGRNTTQEDVDVLVELLPDIVDKARRAGVR